MNKPGTVKGGDAKNAELRIKAFELRKQGFSYRAIGEELKISRQTAYNYVWDTIKDLHKQALKEGKEYLQFEEARLNDYLKTIQWRIHIGDNDAMKLAIKIHERFCKLRGLDAPIKIAHTDKTGDNPLEINVKIVE